MKCHPCDIQTGQAKGANLLVEIGHADLTETATATAQTLSPITLAANQAIFLVHAEVAENFEDTADAANNTNTVTVGDGGSATRFLASHQINANGTPVAIKAGALTQPYLYTVADTVDFFFGAPTTGKTLAALNKGRYLAYFRVVDRYQP